MHVSWLSEILVITFVIGSLGDKLSSVENEQIQQICGKFKNRKQKELVNNSYQEVMSPENKVMYGTRTDPSEAPWVVPIVVYRKEGVMHCSGTLVSSRHVITARHCFVRDYHPEQGFTYVFDEQRIDLSYCRGKDYLMPSKSSEASLHFATKCRDRESCEAIDLSPNLVTRKTGTVILPGICAFNNWNLQDQDDFAIIELDTDVLFSEKIHPICIPKNSYGLFSGANVTIFGFGFDPSDREVSTGILRYESSFMSRCQYESSKYVCSLSHHGKQLACRGDSGGGVIFEDQNHMMLVAVLSRGEPCRLRGESYLGDILAPVYIYLNDICKYTGICTIRRDMTKHDVRKLYGHEEVKVLSNSGNVIDILILTIVYSFFFFHHEALI